MIGDLVRTRGSSRRVGDRRPLVWLGVLTLLGGLFFFGQAQAQVGVSPKIDIVGEIDCLALNIYFEARGEPKLGQIAVGHVVLNRVVDKRYPILGLTPLYSAVSTNFKILTLSTIGKAMIT